MGQNTTTHTWSDGRESGYRKGFGTLLNGSLAVQKNWYLSSNQSTLHTVIYAWLQSANLRFPVQVSIDRFISCIIKVM